MIMASAPEVFSNLPPSRAPYVAFNVANVNDVVIQCNDVDFKRYDVIDDAIDVDFQRYDVQFQFRNRFEAVRPK